MPEGEQTGSSLYPRNSRQEVRCTRGRAHKKSAVPEGEQTGSSVYPRESRPEVEAWSVPYRLRDHSKHIIVIIIVLYMFNITQNLFSFKCPINTKCPSVQICQTKSKTLINTCHLIRSNEILGGNEVEWTEKAELTTADFLAVGEADKAIF